MKKSGRLLIIEGLIGKSDDLTMTDVMDLTMLVAIGGMERSEPEYASLLERAGFTLSRVVPTGSALFVLEAAPR